MPNKRAGKDPVLAAVEAVHAALSDLDAEQRSKVISSVAAILDIANLPLASKARVEDTGGGSTRPPSSRPLSLIELMQEKSPKTNQQRIVLFAYYREKHEGKPRFARADLESYFPKARELPPANYDRDFSKTLKEGWIHEDGDESYVTSKGIEIVESGFAAQRAYSRPREARAKVGGKAKNRRTRK